MTQVRVSTTKPKNKARKPKGAHYEFQKSGSGGIKNVAVRLNIHRHRIFSVEKYGDVRNFKALRIVTAGA